jgi:hypothetical protein
VLQRGEMEEGEGVMEMEMEEEMEEETEVETEMDENVQEAEPSEEGGRRCYRHNHVLHLAFSLSLP